MTLSSDVMPVLIKRQIKTGIFLSLIIAVLMSIFPGARYAPDAAFAAGKIAGIANGKFFIRAGQASVRSITDALHNDFEVEIKGLETLDSEKISLALEADSLEELVKGLLRHLNIKNYAFEFADEKLKLVNIFPGALYAVATAPATKADSTQSEETVTVAVIKSVVESSQADSLGLLPGDLIVEYDGIRINNAAQLVDEVEKKSSKSHIDMLVGRNQSPMRLVVQGGFLGVRITTERISKPAYSDFF